MQPAPSHADNILHEQQSLYSRILVKKTGSMVCLQFNVRREQRNQSCIDQRHPRAMVFSYTRMSMAGLLFSMSPKSILVIGLGGGTLPTAFHTLYPQAHIDAVEIDPAVISVAEEFFDFKPTSGLVVHAQDARVWTKRAMLKAARYDLIVLDAFNGEYIPEHLMTAEYLRETKQLLAEHGTLIANTFAVSDLYDHESTTYTSVFGDFINFRIPESANRVIIVPGTAVSDDMLKQRAAELEDNLRPYAVPIKRYARIIKSSRGRRPDWRTDARILTDQFAPANLLQNR
jgi:spermidine synthase